MLKVVIAEDDLMIADMAEMIIADHGYEVCGIARTVAAAVALCRQHRPELAVFDQRLADGGLGTEIVAQLEAGGRPAALYVTANVANVTLNAVGGHACLTKPYSPADLVRSLDIVAEIAATGQASPPFPRGFQRLPPAPPSPAEPLHG